MLRPTDAEVLDDLGLDYDVETEDRHTCIILSNFPLPTGLAPDTTDLLIRLPPGFPDVAPDMFWCAERIMNAPSGTQPPQTQVQQLICRRQWWRWSRHLNGNWKPTDDLRTFLKYIDTCFSEAGRSAA